MCFKNWSFQSILAQRIIYIQALKMKDFLRLSLSEFKSGFMKMACRILKFLIVKIINIREQLMLCKNKLYYIKEKNMGKRLNVVVERCPKNHKCPAMAVCPVGAISQSGFNAPVVNEDKCIKCGKCSNFCPKKALVLE